MLVHSCIYVLHQILVPVQCTYQESHNLFDVIYVQLNSVNTMPALLSVTGLVVLFVRRINSAL